MTSSKRRPAPIPCDPKQLQEDMARLWSKCGIPSLQVEVQRAWPKVGLRLGLVGRLDRTASSDRQRAIEQLARELEDRGYEIDRNGYRVLGWARAAGSARRGLRARHVELAEWDPQREERKARLRAEREARDALPVAGAAGAGP